MESIIYIELKKLKEETLTECTNFWKIDEKYIVKKDRQEIFEQVQTKINNNKIIHLLESLEPPESTLMAFLLENEGSVKIEHILVKKITTADKLDELISSLETKLLIFVRKSLTKLNQLGNKIFIFNDIYNKLKHLPLFDDYNYVAQHFKKGYIYYDFSFMPDEWSKQLFSNFGFLDYKELILNKGEQEIAQINKLIEATYLFTAFYIDKKIRYVICLNHNKVKDTNLAHDDKEQSYLGLLFFNKLLEVIYYIKTNIIYLTNKGDFRKVDLENLLTIANNDKTLLDILFVLIKDCNFVQITGNTFKFKPEIDNFLNKTLLEKYQILLFQDTTYLLIFSLASKIRLKSFTSVDIYLNYIKDKIKNDCSGNNPEEIEDKDIIELSEIERIIELFYYLGLVYRSELNNIYYYSISKLGFILKSESKIENLFPLESGGVVVNNDYNLIVYDEKVSEYDKYIIEIFCNLVHYDNNVSTYTFDKKTILTAIYLGISPHIFTEILSRNSAQPIDEGILSSIDEWSKQFKTVKFKMIKVLHGDKDTINIIFHSKSLKSTKIEKIGENYLVVNGVTQIAGKITEEEIYVYEENKIE